MNDRAPNASESELQRLILDTADEGFCLFAGEEDRVIAFNQRFVEIFDFDRAWLDSSPTAEEVAIAVYERQRRQVENPREYLATILNHHRSPDPREMELELQDGRIITGRTRAAATGERLYTFRDVTADRQTMRDLEAERERLSILLEHAPVAYYVIDRETSRIVEMSRSIRNLTGRVAEDYLGATHEWDEHIHPDDRAGVVQSVRDAIAAGRTLDVEYRHYHHDGSLRWFREIADPMPERENRPPQMAGVIIDISRAKSAEAKLRESERRFRLLIEGMPNLIFYEHDTNRRLRYLSPSITKILGYEPRELLGRPFDLFREPVGEDDLAKAEAAVRRAIRTRRRQPQYEVRIRHKDGEPRDFEIMEYPVLSSDGEVVGVRGVARDVTTVRELQRQFSERERLAILGTFAGGLAHDLNNLLLPIRGALDALDQARDFNRVHDEAAAIRRATDHLAELTRKILMWTRRESKEPTTGGVTTISAWAPLALQFYRDAILENASAEHAFHVELDIADDAPRVANIDPDLLKQAVLNLVLNSRDAMPEGGTIHIRIGRSPARWSEGLNALAGSAPDRERAEPHDGPEPDGVRFAVTDEGVGMDPKVTQRAFDPFFSTKSRGKSTGLGLALVASIIRSFDGQIRVESERGKGTTIMLDVPALTREEPRAEPRARAAKPGAKALITLRDPMLTAFVSSLLGSLGVERRIASDAKPLRDDLVWIIDAESVDPATAAASLDANRTLFVIGLHPPDDRRGWPNRIHWLDGPVGAERLRGVLAAPLGLDGHERKD
ncbi:MAG: PAS domain S-box protein [Phycisphaerales bacterium]